jgi:hypothetical protein
MKVLITEEQFYNIIPIKIKRKYSEINEFVDDIFVNETFGEVHKRAKTRDKEEFVDGIVSLIVTWFYKANEKPSLLGPVKFLFKDKIESYWDDVNS